jgi:translation initiation factor IF-3
LRISRHRPRYVPKAQEKNYRINHQIKIPQVRLIDEKGTAVGIVSTSEALSMAQDRGLDLIEVSPLANPPVAKIVDYSKMKYLEEKEKRKEKAKQKKVETKGIRLSFRISEHDTAVRVKQAIKFLNQGDKVKLEMLLRGRERQHAELARKNMEAFIEAVSQEVVHTVEQPLTMQGGRFSVVFAKK